MMIDLNPLDVLGKRKLDIMPVHFKKTKISVFELDMSDLINWITQRLIGRYCISTEPCIDSNGQVKLTTFLGFEDQKELTYFILACPYLRRN
jgi:midasin (ATPase involved in ribosome maturation)